VAELASGFSMEIYRARRKEETAGARKLFETFMREHGVAAARTTADRPWCGWFAEVPPGEDLVGSHGRAFDVIVMSRPDADTAALYIRASRDYSKVAGLFCCRHRSLPNRSRPTS
jgi:hypothetical protein